MTNKKSAERHNTLSTAQQCFPTVIVPRHIFYIKSKSWRQLTKQKVTKSTHTHTQNAVLFYVPTRWMDFEQIGFIFLGSSRLGWRFDIHKVALFVFKTYSRLFLKIMSICCVGAKSKVINPWVTPLQSWVFLLRLHSSMVFSISFEVSSVVPQSTVLNRQKWHSKCIFGFLVTQLRAPRVNLLCCIP